MCDINEPAYSHNRSLLFVHRAGMPPQPQYHMVQGPQPAPVMRGVRPLGSVGAPPAMQQHLDFMLPAGGGGSITGSTYMGAEEIDTILRIQWKSLHSGHPYSEDYYYLVRRLQDHAWPCCMCWVSTAASAKSVYRL